MLITDPMFVDPGKHDYRLKPASPAFKLGFKPIHFTKIGLHPEHAYFRPASVENQRR